MPGAFVPFIGSTIAGTGHGGGPFWPDGVIALGLVLGAVGIGLVVGWWIMRT